MAYVKGVWVDDDGSATTGTPVTKARMDNIEQGVSDAHAGLADQDPDLVRLQHGVTKGAAVLWIDANTLRVFAGKGWVKMANGLLRPVSWAQTDVNFPNAVAQPRLDQVVVDTTGAVVRLAGGEQQRATIDNRTNAVPIFPNNGPTIVGVNQLANPSFEVDLAGWTTNATTFQRQNGWARSGAWSARMTRTVTNNDMSAFSAPFTVNPGDTVAGRAALNILQAASGTAPRISVQFDNGGGAYNLGSSLGPLGTWALGEQDLTVLSTPAPAGTTRARLRIAGITSGSQTIDWYLDAVFADTNLTAVPPYGDATVTTTTDGANGPYLRLLDVLVGVAGIANTAAGFRDRRPSAKGIRRTMQVPNTGGTIDKAVGAATGLIDASLQRRFECSGAPLRVRLVAGILGASAQAYINFLPWVDGAALAGSFGSHQHYIANATDETAGDIMEVEFTPALGSHLIGPAWGVFAVAGSTPTGNIYSRGDYTAQFEVREMLEPAIDNGSA